MENVLICSIVNLEELGFSRQPSIFAGGPMSTKDMVIEALEREKGCYVSGEALAQACGVSRNAVWKAVTDLKANPITKSVLIQS